MRSVLLRVLACLSVASAVAVGVAGAGVGHWGPSLGPEGGSVVALAVNPKNPKVVYASASGPWGMLAGGVFKSTDGGRSWRAASTGLNPYVNALVIDPETPSTIYAAAGRVFKSTDASRTWKLAGARSPIASSLAIDPVRPETVYAGGFNGRATVAKSTDGGRHWRSVAVRGRANLWVGSLAVDPVTPTTLYAGLQGPPTNKGTAVLKSTDGGRTWRATRLKNTGYVLSLAIDPERPETVYAAGFNGIFKTTDGGKRWASLAAPGGHVFGGWFAVAIDPREHETVYGSEVGRYASGGGVWVSRDSGRSWRNVGHGLSDSNVFALALDPRRPSVLYAGSARGGVDRSTNGGRTWRNFRAGMRAVGADIVVVHPQRPTTIYIASSNGTHGFYRTSDRGRTWLGKLRGGISELAIDPLEPDTLYAASCGVSRSTDGGRNWGRFVLLGRCVSALAVDPVTPTTLYAGVESQTEPGPAVFKSTDGARTWSATSLVNPQVSALAIDPQTPSTLYAGGSPGVFKSTDGGDTWVETGPSTKDWTRALVVDPEDPSTVYAGTDSGVFKSEDGGRTWRTSRVGLGRRFVRVLVLDRAHPATLLAGTPDGVFRTTNGGDRWVALPSGLATLDVRTLAIDPTGRVLYTGTPVGVFEFRFRH